ncbi:hypothetical protein AWB66_02643 [Caballeronia telluris]|uniref:Uncharacterized protein n=1 Tax=Caballeronia telluris TaxID=326475 RepID=A0A158HVW6_9BURK|nr:hypothetical protein AWB66_02643 [Caballeronia telluris]
MFHEGHVCYRAFKISCFLVSYSFSVISPCLYKLFSSESFWADVVVAMTGCAVGQVEAQTFRDSLQCAWATKGKSLNPAVQVEY